MLTVGYGDLKRGHLEESRTRNRRMVMGYWGLTPQQQPGSYQGGEMMMMMKSVFWWRKPEYPEETGGMPDILTNSGNIRDFSLKFLFS